MKTLLRSRITGFYFQGVDNWTPRIENAYDLSWIQRVVKFVKEAGLKASETELILSFDERCHDIAVPIDERFGLFGSGASTTTSKYSPEIIRV